MKKIAPYVIAVFAGVIVFLFIFHQCSAFTVTEADEEKAQIEEVDRLNGQPTYYVDSIWYGDKVYTASLRREPNRTDGTLPEKLSVTFYEQYTPSAAYLSMNDSIKVDIYDINEESRINGRYVTTTTYEANLFVFVDQIPALRQKACNKE